MKRRRRQDAGARTRRELRIVLRQLAGTCRDPARVIELYYWAAEPDLIGILRRYISLPDEPRDALRAFLTMTSDCPETVEVTVSREGNVTFRSPVVANVMRKTECLRIHDEHAEVH